MNLNEKGISLIEVLVTVMILGIVFTLLFQTTDYVTTATNLHDDQKKAVELAEQELNSVLLQLKEGQSPPSTYMKDGYIITVSQSNAPQSPPNLDRHVSLSGVHTNQKNLITITVTVSWGN